MVVSVVRSSLSLLIFGTIIWKRSSETTETTRTTETTKTTQSSEVDLSAILATETIGNHTSV